MLLCGSRLTLRFVAATTIEVTKAEFFGLLLSRLLLLVVLASSLVVILVIIVLLLIVLIFIVIFMIPRTKGTGFFIMVAIATF